MGVYYLYMPQKKRVVKVVDIVRASGNNKEEKIETQTRQLPRRMSDAEREENVDRIIREIARDTRDTQMPRAQEEAVVDNAGFDGDGFVDESYAPRGFGWKKYAWWGGGFVALVLIIWGALVFLPRVDVRIVPKRVSWTFDSTVGVRSSLSALSVEDVRIPGEVFSEVKNAVSYFPATGTKYVERKAKGTITIYNAYSSAPQTLVATTRFKTPDGKIYRLADKVVVPGAIITGGKIEPSHIDAAVVADGSGPSYNIGPVAKFTIPGFEGGDRFDGFYGSSNADMSGGFVGQSAYPTDSDIEVAKKAAEDSIKGTLLTSFSLNTLPKDFEFIPNTEAYTVGKSVVDTDVNDQNQFSVVIDGKVEAIAFRSSDLLALLKDKGLSEAGLSSDDYVVESDNLTKADPTIDWKTGNMTLPVQYQATFVRNIDVAALSHAIAGKSETDLKSTVFGLSGIEKATASFWPFWVSKAPTNEKRITISIE